MGWVKRRLPKKRWKRVCLYLLSGCVILLAGDMVLVQCWRRVEIGYDTTRITGPLKADGMPDYVAARNAECSKGVTAENNAAPELFAIIGTQRWDKATREALLPQLGLSAESTPSLVTGYWDWLEGRHAIYASKDSGSDNAEVSTTQQAAIDAREKEYSETNNAPWKGVDHPERLQWLEEQQPVVEQLHRALEKDRLYVPQMSFNPAEVTTVMMPWITGVRQCGHLLAADAMHAAGEADIARYQRDVLDIARLGRLVAQGSTLIEYLSAVSIEDEASGALQHGATARVLDATHAHELLQRWLALPAFPDESAVLNEGERFFALQTFCEGSQSSLRAAFGGEGVPNRMQSLLVPIHFNAGLRTFNHYYDELVAAYRLPTYAQRAAANKAIAEESVKTRNWLSIADLLVTVLMPSLGKTVEVQERGLVDHDLATLALALRVYRDVHGEFPADLAVLSPEVVAAVPSDGFADKPFHYRRDGKGYLLYSVGPDGQDDGGRQRETGNAQRWDMVVRASE